MQATGSSAGQFIDRAPALFGPGCVRGSPACGSGPPGGTLASPLGPAQNGYISISLLF